MHTRRAFLRTAAAGIPATLLLAACNLDRSNDDGADDTKAWGGEALDEGIPLPTQPLTTMDGERTSIAELGHNRLTLVSFGYTYCPDVCPLYLNAIARTIESLEGVIDQPPLVLFVGVDTKRDTPEQLRRYLARVHPDFIGLTGTPDEIQAANKAVYNAPFVIGEPDENGDYEVEHIARIFAFTKDGLAHRYYPADIRQEQLRPDLIRLDQGRYR